ncbi:MAG: tRNA (adenosine(37)-N6)-dimethylallyltransferase MiaA [Candidatus Omnitrophica bacterium]|nr:tRNA (adenosine(37)-N6)-dimethylallyltransferase MiaA [Candidatus Omnitrophota bacterium]
MPVVCLVGPTAAGKSELALALAKKLNGEIISCDSMQIYRGIDIASGKPTKTQSRRIKHHLIDILKSSREYNAARFQAEAKKIIKKIHQQGKLPLLVGGTGLYLRALLDGLFKGPGQSIAWRRKFYQQAQKHGPAYLHQKLQKIDPEAARSIHPHDLRRIVRALEVYQTTKQPISELRKKTEGLRADYDWFIFGLNRPRHELYQRIERRVESMFRRGLAAEIKRLSRQKISQTAQALLGYKEISGWLNGEYSKEKAKELLKRNTRHYAKRQLSWFRKEKDLEWIEIREWDNPKLVANKIIALLADQLTS